MSAKMDFCAFKIIDFLRSVSYEKLIFDLFSQMRRMNKKNIKIPALNAIFFSCICDMTKQDTR